MFNGGNLRNIPPSAPSKPGVDGKVSFPAGKPTI